MIPRGKLDISFKTLFRGFGYCVSSSFNQQGQNLLVGDTGIYCLSVRTGLHLTLRALNFEPGAEILVTAINIPDMFGILGSHHLKLVPLQLDRHTLELNIKQIEEAITSSTKAILIGHLFGAIINLDEIIILAKKHGIIIIEDCAQAFDGRYLGNPLSDVVMFSFGLIKTNTCIGGALIYIRDIGLLSRVVNLNNEFPQQSIFLYFKKLMKAFVVKLTTTQLIYTLLYQLVRSSNRDFDKVLSGFTRGLPGENVIEKVSFRPSDALIKMLKYRLANFSSSIIFKRQESALNILEQLSSEMKIGDLNRRHSHWVLPIATNNPDHLIGEFRKEGIDATAKASSLVQLAPSSASQFELQLEQLIYVPLGIPAERVKKMCILRAKISAV